VREINFKKENLQECPKYFLGIIFERRIREYFASYDCGSIGKLPMHITVLPPFYNLFGNQENLIKQVRNCCSEIPIFYVGLSQELGLFSKGKIGHYQFDDLSTFELKGMHNHILNFLSQGISLNSEFIGRKYHPHVVRKFQFRPGKAEYKNALFLSFVCKQLELWRKDPGQKNWDRQTKINLMSKYYYEGDRFSVIPPRFEYYRVFEIPPRIPQHPKINLLQEE
jgi:hypothetical protein